MENEVKIIVVASINTKEMESFQHYITGLKQCYERVNAITEVQIPIGSTFLGNMQPDFISIISFQNHDAFDAVYSSKEYKELLTYRDQAFKDLEVYFIKKE